MLDPSELKSLLPGDIVEAGPLLAGLSNEPLLLRVTEISEDRLTCRFEATFFGVLVYRLVGRAGIDRVEWSETPL